LCTLWPLHSHWPGEQISFTCLLYSSREGFSFGGAKHQIIWSVSPPPKRPCIPDLAREVQHHVKKKLTSGHCQSPADIWTLSETSWHLFTVRAQLTSVHCQSPADICTLSEPSWHLDMSELSWHLDTVRAQNNSGHCVKFFSFQSLNNELPF
jgi:hypothetical protein